MASNTYSLAHSTSLTGGAWCGLLICFFTTLIATCALRAEPAPRVIVPTSRAEARSWKYAEQDPGADWSTAGFDDSGWSTAPGGFGSEGTPNAQVRTPWHSNAIWLRSTVELTSATLPRHPHVLVFHDEDVRIYVNGRLVVERPFFTTDYVRLPIIAGPFVPGTNVIAVQCKQTTHGQFIDVGIIDVPQPPRPPGEASVDVDFAVDAGTPLLKTKFNVYDCPFFKMDRWDRDIHLIEELNCESLRYDPTWGGFNEGRDLNSPQISGASDHLVYNLTDFDRLTDSLLQRGIRPMYVHAYTPLPLQGRKGVWATPPTDMKVWREICRYYAAHWLKTRRRVPFYEMWNEPDNPPWFFQGTQQDYFQIYRNGSAGVLDANPDAIVGGPAIAAWEHNTSWIRPFLDFVTTSGVRLDFLSFHNYGDPGPTIDKVRAELRSKPSLATTEMQLTEYNSYVPMTPDFSFGGRIETYVAASRLLHDFKYLLEQTDVTKVYWAMFNESEVFGKNVDRCGLVSLGGHRKASFNAFAVYGRMPTPRKLLRSSSRDVEGFASADADGAAAAIWNISDADQQSTLSMANLPFAVGRVELSRIDEHHASYCNDPLTEQLKVDETWSVTDGHTIWTGMLPAHGVAYFRIVPRSSTTAVRAVPVGEHVRNLYDFSATHSPTYAEFDPRSWEAWLGTVDPRDTCTLIGAKLRGLPTALHVQTKTSTGALAWARVDYEGKEGFARSVEYQHSPNVRTAHQLRWGTKRPADELETRRDPDFIIQPSRHAPKDWTGTVIVTFGLDSGDARAHFKLSPAR